MMITLTGVVSDVTEYNTWISIKETGRSLVLARQEDWQFGDLVKIEISNNGREQHEQKQTN